MLLQLFHVDVPAEITRTHLVPEYDVPIIKLLWKRTNMIMQGQMITVKATGQFVNRSLYEEEIRIKSDYGVNADAAPEVPAFKAIYRNNMEFEQAYMKAVKESEEAMKAMASNMSGGDDGTGEDGEDEDPDQSQDNEEYLTASTMDDDGNAILPTLPPRTRRAAKK